MMKQLFFLCIYCLTLAGCTHLAEPLAMPEKPAMEQDTAVLDIPVQPDKTARNETVQSPSHKIRQGSRIFISAPLVKKKYRINDTIRTGVSFQNDNSFKIFEQQTEKNLLLKGLNVVSREKLEAELRSFQGMHSEANAKPEIFDISGMIRAAQLNGNKGGYLLKIEALKLENSNYEIDLAGFPEFQQLSNRFPEAAGQLLNHQFLHCSEAVATIEGKIIDIPTGEVIWIGSQSFSSRGLSDDPLQLRIAVSKGATNEQEIVDFVNRQNTEQARKLRYDRPVAMPVWQYATHVSEPTVVKGRCQAETSDAFSEFNENLIKEATDRFLARIEVMP